jgi:DNA-directed RNA polymerase subunit RPC12/RpoP
MIKCSKCSKTMMIDRIYNSISHLEIFCLLCGSRKFFHPPSESEEGRWLLKKEIERAKITMSPL